MSAISEQAQQAELLRLVTCGSVDDGKSTLIGRLLYDTKQIFVDQMEHIEETSKRRGDGYVNLALLTDGLRAEREQGITIDVAYRSFVTPRRRFQLADAPGHVQYTRNMVTGASTADVAVILVDARNGVVEQTRRHAYITTILRVPHITVAVNKMDLVDWSQERYDEIARDLETLGLADLHVIPMSALQGDNVVDGSREHAVVRRAPAPRAPRDDRARLRPEPRRAPLPGAVGDPADVRRAPRLPRLCGHCRRRRLARRATRSSCCPSGLRSRVEAVETADGPLGEAVPPQSVTIRLADDVDVSRGNMLADPDRPPIVARELEARVCWMSERPLEPRAKLAVKHTTRSVRAIAEELVALTDIHTLEDVPGPERLELNDIGVVRLRLSEPLAVDPYAENRETGAFILIDEATNDTVGAGMVISARVTWQFTLTGLLIGSLVGLTGMGGGSLMTPILVILFGFKPTYAVGTDILHGAIFKSFGAIRHRRLGTVHARLTLWMFAGSGPLSLAGVGVATVIKHHYGESAQSIESYAVGAALVAGGIGFLAKSFIKRGVQSSDSAVHPLASRQDSRRDHRRSLRLRRRPHVGR